MQTSHLVVALVTAGVFAVGVFVGANAFESESPPPPENPPPSTAAPEPEPTPEPMLGPDEATLLRSRVAALETRVESLEAELADANEKTKPLLDLYEKFETGEGVAIPGHSGVVGGDVEILDGTPFGPGDVEEAKSVASALGLAADRQKAFADEAQRVVDQIKALEKANAEVTVDGDTTTIRIGRYEADGAALARQWDDWVAANLTSDEQAAYAKSGAKSKIFGNRFGGFDRTVTIRDKDGTVTMNERAESDGGENVTETEVSGPSMAREFVLQGYNHLLK